MYQHDSPSTRGSGVSDGASDGATGLWKDSDAHTYGNYLDNSASASAAAAGAGAGMDMDMQLRPTMANNRMTTGAVHQDIAVGLLDEHEASSSDAGGAAAAAGKRAYSGRKVVWPGALFLLVMTLAASAAVTYFGVEQYNEAQKQQKISEEFTTPRVPRKALPLKLCRVPNYVTDETKLYATGGGKQHEVHFTGINWSGMENKEGVPHGLASRQSNLDDIAQRLSEMEINAVRLPLNAKMVIEDSAPDVADFVNRVDANLFGVSNYVDMIKKVVQGLARKQIAVLLDLHKIDPEYDASTSEELWYTDDYPEDAIIKMFVKLAKELCNEKHYNIIGVDVKNEPVAGCWPAKDTDDYCPRKRNWPRAVERIGNAILAECPNWLIVVEGLSATNIKSEINGEDVTYSDWFGASLQNATKNPIKLDVENKIVYAPHFYSPSVYPSSYFFAKQSSDSNGDVSVEEYPITAAGNKSLHEAVGTVLDAAFGDLLTKGAAPVFYGEFGGIYGSKELLKDKTSTRVIDYLIEYAEKKKMIGGFSWALNPDGNYDFNDVYVGNDDSKAPWEFGLYADETWDSFNEDYAEGLRQLKGNGIIPCFDRTVSASSSSASGANATEEEDTTGSSATTSSTTTDTDTDTDTDTARAAADSTTAL